MVDGGYKQTYEEFVKGFTGNANYANRKLVYDTFKEGGADVGSTYAEFMQRLRTPRKETVPFSVSSIQATIDQTQDFGKRTDKKLSAVKRNPLGVAKTTLGFPSSSKPANKRVEDDGYSVTWNGDKPQISRRYADTDGYTYDSAAAADWAQGDIDKREAAERAIARLGTEEDVRARLARAYEDRERISDEIDEEQDSRPWWQRMMMGGSSVRAGLMRDEIEKSARSDMQQVEARISELEDALNTIQEAKATAADDKFTARAVSGAKQAYGDGWLGRAAQWGAKKGGDTIGFFKGAGRGIVDTLKKKSFYDAGESGARNASATLSAVRHAGTDEYTDDERKLLDAAAYNAYVQGTYGSKIGRGYKAGGVTAESLPFMLEMILNPASGLGHGLQRKVMRNLVSKYGKAAVKKATKKYMAKKLGARAAGDLAAAATMTATTGQMRVAGDTMQRMTGEIQPDISPDGDIVFKGTEGAEDNAFAAYAKAFGAQTIENHSEMVGEYFAPLIGAAGKAAGRVLGKVKPLSKLSDKMRLSSVADFIRDVNSSNWKQNVDGILKRAKFDGTIGEYAEEVVGNIENALTVGDMTLDSAENTGVFNKDINIDTFLGVGLMSGFCSTLGVAGYRGRRKEALRDLSRIDDAIYKGASPALATRWTDVREKLLRGTEEEATAALNDFMADERIPFSVRNAATKYGIRAQVYRGTVAAERKEAAERERQRESAKDMPTRATEWLSDMQDAGDAGYLTEGAEGMNDAKNRLDDARAKVAQAFGIHAEDVDGFIGDAEKWVTSHIDSAEEAALNAAMEYGLAKKRFDGMVSRAKDGMEREVSARTAETDAKTNKDTGTIIGGTLRERNPDGTERGVHVIGGNVALNADGTIDTENSAPSLIVVDRATGEKMMVSPDALASVDAPIDAAQEKARVADETRKECAERMAGMIDGTADLSAGATYTLTDKDGNTRQVVVTADKDGNTENADGTVNVSADGGKTIERVSRDEIEQAADKSRKEATRQRDEEKKAAESQEAAAVHGQPRYQKGQTFVLADGTSGEIVDVDEDGGVVVNTEEPMADGRMSARIEKADFDAALQRVTDEDGNLYWERADESAEDGNGVQAEGNTPAVAENGESVPEKAPVAQGEENGEAPVPTADTENTPQPEEDAMPMKREKDGRTTPDFYAATPERTHRYVYKDSGLDREEADAFVEAKRKEAEAKAEGKSLRKPKMGTDIEKYKADKARYEAAKKEAEAELAYWEEVKRQQDKVVVAEREEQRKKLDERVEAAKEEERQRIEEEERKKEEQRKLGANAVGAWIRDKWGKARKKWGKKHEIILADDTTVSGRYVLVESGAATASHDALNGFAPSEGFPVNENGQNLNDRDYERDTDAQGHTRRIAGKYNGRALQEPVVVTRDGVVLSGNGRTMAGEMAARDGSDGEYTGYLRRHAEDYGFTEEDVAGMEHPRVLFVPDEPMPYTTATMAKFNKSGMKQQSKTETAVKMGKLVDDALFGRIAATIGGYDTLGAFYADDSATAAVVRELAKAGVVSETEIPSLFDGGSLSQSGQELIESLLVGKLFAANPDAVRQLTEVRNLRQSVAYAIQAIVRNSELGGGYSLADELARAVRLAYLARKNGFKAGDRVSGFARQGNLFQYDDGATVEDFSNATVMMLADALNDGRVSLLKSALVQYNELAADAAAGVADIFSGKTRTKEDIIKFINDYLFGKRGKAEKEESNGREQDESASKPDAESGTGGGSVEESNGRNGAGSEQKAGTGELDNAARLEQRREKILSHMGDKYSLSDEHADNGEAFVQDGNGSTELAAIPEEVFERIGISPIPFKLTETMAWHVFDRHGKEAKLKSVSDAVDFVLSIVNNADHVRLGRDGSFIFSVEDGRKKVGRRAVTIMIESGSGKFMGIRTSGYETLSDLKERPLLWERGAHAVPEDAATPTITTIEPQKDGEGTSRTKGQSDRPSADKATDNAAPEQAAEEKSGEKEESKGYTIAPATYTNKKGKTSDVHLLTFEKELTEEQARAVNEFAKERTGKGRFAPARGWKDRESGGWMFRTEEDARKAAELAANPEAVADNQPLSAKDMRDAVKTDAPKEETKPERAAEGGTTDAQTGETKTEETKPEETKAAEAKTNPSGNRLVTDERYEELKKRMRAKLRGQLNMGVDPEILAIGTEMAVYHIEKGARKFAEFAKDMIADLGEAVRPYLKAFYNGARDLPEMAEYAEGLTPYDEVRAFDTANFDKPRKDVFAQAEMVAAESKAEADAEKAERAIKDKRNAQRKEQEKQKQTDTGFAQTGADATFADEAATKHNGEAKAEREANVAKGKRRTDDELIGEVLKGNGHNWAKFYKEAIDKGDTEEAYKWYRALGDIIRNTFGGDAERANNWAEDVFFPYIGNDAFAGYEYSTKPEIVPAPEGIKPVGKGTFGDVYDQFKGKPQEAAAFLTSHKGGDLLGVFSRDGVGEIDVVWGDERGGFAHILGKHVGEGKSFPTASEAARAIDEIIKTGEVSFENGDKVVFEKDGKVVTIRKNVREGGKKIAAKNWVLTAYDEMSADGGVSAIAPANEVQAARHTDKPRGKVTPKSSDKKANGGKKGKEGQAAGDLFAGLTDTSETNKEQDNGLERHHAGVRSEGLPADGSGQQQGLRGGERSRSQGTGQESGGTDAGRRGLGTREDGPLQVGLSGLSERKNKRNNHSERGEDHAPKSVDARIDANIKAIELAQELLGSGETATPEQMGVLRRFSGWGGLGAAFNEASRDWKQRERNRRIRELLGEEAYGQAVLSSKSAYYTPASVVDALWDIAAKLGFKGGSVLEGSAGIGNILGQMPTEMSGRSDIRAIEIDSTSGGILSLLYPDAQVEIQGFEQTRIPNGSVDLAITNVPFVADLRVNDTTGDGDLSKKFRKIQDFCIAKNVRKLREGGIGIFITSNATLDSGKALREWVTGAGGADFIGAFRLNNKTFGGTPVTSDIIVIRKRVNGQKSAQAIDASAVGVERTAEYREKGESKTKRLPMDYNGYFIEHPDHMAGEMRFGFEEGDTYRPTGKGLYPAKGKDQGEMLSAFASSFEEERVGDKSAESENPSLVSDASADGKKVGEMYLKDGKLVVAEAGGYYPLALNANKIKGHTKEECFQAYTAIKTALADVFKYQTENEDDAGLKPLLDKLNKAYDTFVSTYGHFNKNNQLAWLRNDVEYPNVFSLETYKELGDGKGGVTKTYDKADVMSKRVVEKKSEPHPTNVKDGVLVSMSQRGRIDIPYMAGLLGMEEEAVKREILDNGLGFEDPATREVEVAHLYLSGNVREKLRQAEACNENGEYSANIKALQDVVPMNIPAHLIDFSLGSSWLDPKLYSEYVKERTGIDVRFTAAGGTWLMEEPSRVNTEMNRSMGVTSELLHTTKFGHELIEAAMKKKTVTMSTTSRRRDGTTETVTDREATAACAAKIDEIRQDFKDWMRQKMQGDAELSARMEREYNDRFNSYAPVKIPEEFAPEHFEGATPKFKMRPHQSKAIVRATMQPLLFAHEVGTGKTFTLISAAMEMRRLGTARKPMIVVQNATVAQFAGSAKELYPNAKILTLEDGDRNAEGRMRFYAKIKYNDWDMVIVPQSVFEKIPDSEKRQIAFIQDKIDEKLATLERMRAANIGKSKSAEISRAENELEALRAEMAALSDGASGKLSAKAAQREAVAKKNAAAKAQEMLERRTDAVEDFDDMGIDALLVDEAHEYKHLGFTTAMQRGVKGVDPSYSKKSQSVYLKAQAVLEKNHGRNVVFATGTPISNTAAEVWTFMRYLMSKETMEEYGIYYFDDFVSNFGNIQQMLEFSTSGKYKENNRFAGYVNLPELVRIWSSVADTVLTKDQKELVEKIPELEGGKAQDIYLPQTRSLRSVMKYVRAELARYEEMSGKEKKENSSIPLTMYGVAQAAAIDARLVMAEAEDDPNNKTNEAVRQTLRSLKETDSYKGTVAIFADHYQNKRSGFNLYEDIKAKLVAQGVPASEIVVIKSGMTIKKKQEIFDKVNHGEVRVILGSTSLLGTGVNIQERLHTLIHLDAPNRPMDYTQRNGRILRQGNLHKEWGKPVRVLRFGVEDSLDVTAYQRLKTKGAIADSIMEGERLMADSMNNRVLEEEEDVFGDTVALLSGSEYAMLKNNAEKNVRKYESRRKQWQADQAYIHSAKPKMEGQIKAAEQRAQEAEAHLQAVQKAFPGGKFKEIVVGKHKFATVEEMADFVKEHNKKTLDAAKAMKENPTTASQSGTLTLSLGGYDFAVKTELSREVASSGGALFSEVRRKMTYSCPALGLADVPVRQALLRNAVEDITENVITGKDFAEQLEAAARQAEHGKSELEQLRKREGKPFEFEKELAEAERQFEEYSEAMKAEMAEKEKKYAEMDASVKAATGVATDETADAEAEKFRDGEEEELAAEADAEMRQAMTDRVNELSGRLNTPVRVISTEEEFAALPNDRQRRAKGWFDTRTGEVTIVLPNNADAADVENTFLHEVVGHDGLRVLFPEEGQLDNALDELYRVSERGIRERIDAAAREMLEAEVARLMEQKRRQHEAKGENPNTFYYADLAEASLEASKKRDQYRRHAAEEYAADLAGRIGVEGFEKMSAEEQTFWGRLKAMLQNALRRLSSGLGIKSKREWTDKEWAYVLHEAYKRKKNGGRPSAFDVADTMVMRGKTEFGEANKEETSIDEVNGRFNEQLSQFTTENADKINFDLGLPSEKLLSAGVANKPIRLHGSKVTKKMKKHGFSIEELRDLPKAVANPIAVFDNYGKNGNRSVLTELRTANGNFLVAIDLGKGTEADFDIVSSVFGKQGDSVAAWINKGYLRYVDKKKALDYLHLSAPIAEASDNTELSSAAKVVKDFVNPKETGEKNADTDMMFRDGNAVEYKKAQARDTYERRVSKGLYQAREALQDSMLSLKVAMDTIMKAEGKKTRIEDIAGYENAYLGENRLSSVNQAECKEYARTLFKPLLEEVAKLASTADERAELTDYMMAKHGLERNKVMARRNAKRQADEEFGEEISKVQRELEKHPDDDKLTIRAHELALAKAKREEEIYLADSRDYSGLTALTQTDSKAAAEAEAQRMVEEYEKAHDTDKLWRRTRDVTGATLEKCYDCGLISAAQYSDIRSMYKHYIPLRGFDEKTDAEAYAHIGDKRSGFATPIKTARGRKSKADDPFANMEAMMESAIMAGNRNSLVKQRFLNFVLGHPSDLVSVNDLWLVHDDAADEWKPAHPGEVADTERIEEDDTPEEVERKMREFEKRMKALAAEDPQHYTRQGDAPNVYYRLVDNEDLKQHQVVVKRNGKAVVLTINGNPRAAQALNGLTNPDNAVGGIAKFFEWGEAVNRQLSAFYTTRNPDFVVSNFVRDSVYANTMVWAKESPNYAARFNLNWAKLNPAEMKMLLAKFRDGTLDEGNETEKMFRQFMLNGGETGYTSVRDIEKRKKDIAKELKKLNGQMPVGKALELLGERFDEINRAVENCARFAAFMTSRQMGRSIDRSIWDAKEVSVNFNKKGSGAKFHGAKGQTWLGNKAALASGFGRSFYVFWNAAVQGTTNFGRNVGRHPVKGLAGAAAMFALGMLAAGIGGGDDDDKDGYYNLPDYVRRSNIVFRAPGMDESWISVPLPVEYRALYGMGELAMSVMSGKAHYSAGELAHEMASQVSQMLPLDVLEGGGGASAFVPSSVKPIAEILGNKSWTGLPIYKENDWNKDDPQYKKVYKNANKALVAASKWTNEATGGDEYTSGWGDVVNPAVVEHLLNGYFGGVARSIGEVAAMGETLAGKREYDPKDFMFVNRLVKRGDERTEYRAVNNEYFRVKEASVKLRKRLRHYEEDTAKGVFDYAEKIRELNYSPDFRALWAFEAHEPEIDAINEQLKEPALSAEYRKELETELNAAKRRLVDAVNEARGEKR